MAKKPKQKSKTLRDLWDDAARQGWLGGRNKTMQEIEDEKKKKKKKQY